MASFQSSSTNIESKSNVVDIKTDGIHHFHDLAASSPPNLSQLLPITEGGHSRDGDAVVPSFFPTATNTSTTATSPSTPTATTITATEETSKPSIEQEPPKSYWDHAFYTSTPTPKPPPRLAPMPRSPPPPPLAIRTHIPHQQVQKSTAESAIPVSERMAPKSKSRYASAYQAHNRSISHSQAHSHHGNNIFTHSSLDPAPGADNNSGNGINASGLLGAGGSPSLGSYPSTNNSDTTETKGFSPEQLPLDGTPKGFSYSSTPILSHASPAAGRSIFRLDSPHLHHPQGYFSSQHLPASSQQSNPLLTPSSSQSSLFSNLPSPMTRTSLSSTANIFKDPPASFSSAYQSSSSRPSNWTSIQTVNQAAGDSISDMNGLLSQFQPQHQYEKTDANAAVTARSNSDSTPSLAAITGLSSSNSQQRKIYPGLKNTVGPYRLLHNIGQGSFSEVKLAIDTRTGDHVAIKVMSRAMVQSSDRLGISVRRESDLLKSIQHPNIVNFREVVETSLQMCIVLDYASGGELFEYVADKRAIATEEDIQCIFAQIVDAVDYLHQLNIVHRDLKLENVLLEPRPGNPLRPRVKLTDFGLAKVIDADSPLLTTRCGSEDYAAPEIILGQPYDGREADIWSLGVVLYALLVGFLPFNMRSGMSRKSFLSMIAHAEFGFPGEKVLMTKASLMSLQHQRQRSSSTASNASSTSVHAYGGSGIGSTNPAATVAMLLPAATPDTPSTLDSTLAASATSAAAAAAKTIASVTTATAATTSMIVPKMRGVSSVSEESKDLVRWLLQAQGSDRPTARQLRDHPWVAAGRTLLNGSSSTTTRDEVSVPST
ncbi:NUAK SNF1-like kinase 1 [Linnemannia zychae]|nr:NUAK SNF1-like kinase 1 [Linnemannia zychae]